MFAISSAFGWSDFKLKYRGSFFGFMWSFLFPLAKFFVILHIAGRIVANIAHYPLYLFLGILLWEHFAQTSSSCIRYIKERSSLFQKVAFPRELLMFSIGWMELLILGIYFAIFILFMMFYGVALGWNLLLLPLIALQATLLGLGIGMLLGAYALKYQDIAHIWSILLQILFWLTPVLYSYAPQASLGNDALAVFREGVKPSLFAMFDLFIRFQPLSILLHDARRMLLYPDTLGIPSLVHIAAYTAVLLFVFFGGLFVFKRRSVYFLQES